MRDFQKPGRSAVYAANGMCATSHPLASQVAVEILKSGGNAVDAAIAAAILLGVCEPQMTGIGGDCFVLVKPAGTEKVTALNGSGRAPMGLKAADLRARGLSKMPVTGIEPVTVPGAIDAFCRLSERFGKLSLAEILAPAIHYADEGVPVAPRVVFDWKEDGGVLKGAARDWFMIDGKIPQVGQVFRHTGMAEVLRRVSKEGRAGFYEGEVAEDMVASLRALGGTHTLDDFAATEATWGEPVSGLYRGTELIEHRPNGQGATAILLAKILSHFDVAALDPFGAERLHLEAEASKLAYDARDRFIADPDRTKRLDHMIADETAAKLAGLINMGRAMPSPKAATEALHKETVYVTVVDRDRMAVSLIYSIYHGFGAGLASDKFGINFQNRGSGFTLEEGHPNEATGGQRPMHTIIPGMLATNGRIEMPFGVMGGSYQPTGHVRLLSNLKDFGMDVQAAIDAPRGFSMDGKLSIERGYDPKVAQALADLGHNVSEVVEPLGGAQAIIIGEDGVLTGGSDPRKDGCALGY
ncbi:MAG: gamma-glutamyltransferase family protein [Rhodobacteraceae bacterium]|nr:gamma-glutamyltransferase family protein [Paracoccaceae bacterium]